MHYSRYFLSINCGRYSSWKFQKILCNLYVQFCKNSTFYAVDCCVPRHMFYTIPFNFFPVQLVAQSLSAVYVEKMVEYLAIKLESSCHLQFYLSWCNHLLTAHGTYLKEHSASNMSKLRDLQKSIVEKQNDLGSLWVVLCGSLITCAPDCSIRIVGLKMYWYANTTTHTCTCMQPCAVAW